MTKRHDSAYGPPDRRGENRYDAGEACSERVRIDEVRERLHAVDLDDGQERPVARLELGVATDVDEVELESEFGPGASTTTSIARAQRLQFAAW